MDTVRNQCTVIAGRAYGLWAERVIFNADIYNIYKGQEKYSVIPCPLDILKNIVNISICQLSNTFFRGGWLEGGHLQYPPFAYILFSCIFSIRYPRF